jgi:hypothetical protein
MPGAKHSTASGKKKAAANKDDTRPAIASKLRDKQCSLCVLETIVYMWMAGR